MQLTFCKAFERLDSYRGESSLYGWFCQICRNAIADRSAAIGNANDTRAIAEDDATIEAILETLRRRRG